MRPELWLMINCAYVILWEDLNRLLTNSEVRLMLLSKYLYSVITKSLCQLHHNSCIFLFHQISIYVVCIYAVYKYVRYIQNMQQRRFEQNLKTFCPFYVGNKGRLWHFMFVQEHGVLTLKNRRSPRILNKPTKATPFLISAVEWIVASWKWALEMFRCKPTQKHTLNLRT